MSEIETPDPLSGAESGDAPAPLPSPEPEPEILVVPRRRPLRRVAPAAPVAPDVPTTPVAQTGRARPTQPEAERPRPTQRSPIAQRGTAARQSATRRPQADPVLGPTPTKRGRVGRAVLSGLGVLGLLCLMLAMIGGAGLLGAQAGEQERQVVATRTVQAYIYERFQKCLDFKNAGNYPRAQVECETVQKFQPNQPGIRDLVATVIVAQTPTAPPPLPTPTPVLTDKGQLFELLKTAFSRKDWDTVILLGDQLRALDANYEAASVASWRYAALTTRGIARLRAGAIEAGIFDLDIAERIQKLDANAAAERNYAELYQNAISTFGADWETAIRRLTQLYQASPAYRDVGARLFQAYVGAGDSFAGRQDWCPAEKRYASALALVPGAAGLDQKRGAAAQQCLTATPVPITGTGTLTGTGAGGGALGGGRLVYAGPDPTNGSYSLFISDGGTARSLAPGAGQPTYRNGGVVVLSGGGAIRTTAGATLLAQAGQYGSLSPDGKRVAYAAGGVVYVAGVGGTPAPVSLGPGSWPNWGPGAQLVMQSCQPAGCGLWLVNPDKPEEKTRLTEGAGDINPSWSPNGQEIVYAGGGDLYVVTLGRQFRKLTGGMGVTAPTFSPDGSRIAFQASQNGTWGIFVLPAHGGDPTRVVELGPQHPLAGSERTAWIP